MTDANWDVETLRVFLHVLAAGVWVGGQIVVAMLVPAMRRIGPEATQAAAQTFARVAWPFFVLSVITGLWNMFEVDMADATTSWNITFGTKVLLVVLTGVAAWLHIRATTLQGKAILGGISGVTAVAALLVGVAL